jgi:DNA-binding response OmpR family regulator
MAHILVVDDEPGLRDFVSDALAGAGHRVVTAPDGETAFSELEASPVDLLVLDLRLPGRFDGMDVLRHARAELPELPVIVLTAHGSVESAVEAMRLGAVDFLEKPVDGPAELRRLAARALAQRRAGPLTARADPMLGTIDAGSNDEVASFPILHTSRFRGLATELRRRRVPKTAATYLAVAFITLEAAQLVLPVLPLPAWTYLALISMAIAGFPLALALGWVYDVNITRTRAAIPDRLVSG